MRSRVTRNCSSWRSEPSAATFCRTIFWPSFFAKSMTTSTRSAGAIEIFVRLTGAGRRPDSVPIWVNAWPLLRARSYEREFEALRIRSRYLRSPTTK